MAADRGVAAKATARIGAAAPGARGSTSHRALPSHETATPTAKSRHPVRSSGRSRALARARAMVATLKNRTSAEWT